MSDQPKQKRWRPRFSLRTLLVLVTLTCVYFAAWEVTKNLGVSDVRRQNNGQSVLIEFASPMPFVVSVAPSMYAKYLTGATDTSFDGTTNTTGYSGPFMVQRDCVWYVWFFGWTWETPIRSEVSNEAQVERLKAEYDRRREPHSATLIP